LVKEANHKVDTLQKELSALKETNTRLLKLEIEKQAEISELNMELEGAGT
jgi:hypothetical protein